MPLAEARSRPSDEPLPPVRIAISGAAGRVGYGLVFHIAAGQLFGFDQPVCLRLLDLPASRHLLEATRLELQDCAFPLLESLKLSTEPAEAFADADWIIMLAGAPLAHDRMTREDLVRVNSPIYIEHARVINRVAASARMLVVAEPCNTNCFVALKNSPSVPQEHWLALNRLDRIRATALIAEKAGVPVSRVNRVTVWGNHSERLYVDFHNAYIGDQPAHQVITDKNWARKVLEPAVAKRERELFELRGKTPSATAVQGILGTIRSLIIPTPVRHRFGAAVVSRGDYGVPEEIVFGLPLRTEDGRNWSVVPGLYLDDYAHSRLAENVEELEREAVVAGL